MKQYINRGEYRTLLNKFSIFWRIFSELTESLIKDTGLEEALSSQSFKKENIYAFGWTNEDFVTNP